MGSVKQDQINRQQADANKRSAERAVEEKRKIIDAALHQDKLSPMNTTTNLARRNLFWAALAALALGLFIGFVF